MEPIATPGELSSLIGHDIHWFYGGLLNGPNETGIPANGTGTPGNGSGILGNGSGILGNGSKAVTALTMGERQYVGCHVVNGFPMPELTLNIGTLDLRGESSLQVKKTTSAGPAGYEVPQFDQRIDHFFDVTWKYDRRIVECLADNTVDSMYTGASTTLSVKGNTPLTRPMFSYRRLPIDRLYDEHTLGCTRRCKCHLQRQSTR